MASSVTSIRRGGTCRVASLVVLCSLLFFFVSTCDVRGADVGDEEGGTAASGGEGAVGDDEKADSETLLNQLVAAQSDLEGDRGLQLARFNEVSDDIEKEWKTYAMASAGAAGVGGLGALLSHLAKAKLEKPMKGKSESERNEFLNESPAVRRSSAVAGGVRAVTGALAGVGLAATIYALTRLLLAKQERRKTNALYDPRGTEWLKRVLNKTQGEANDGLNQEEGGEDEVA